MRVPFEALWHGVCAVVCQRWARLVKSAPIQQHKRDGRWAAYAAGVIRPCTMQITHTDSLWHISSRWDVNSIAVGPDGRIYSGSSEGTILVWPGKGSRDTPLELNRFSCGRSWGGVSAIAVGLNGKVYSAST